MTVYVALLGGINVGGRTLKMDALRATAERCGFDDVSTFIQSGNVIFRSRLGARSGDRPARTTRSSRTPASTRGSRRVPPRSSARSWRRTRCSTAATIPTKLSVTFLFDGVTPTLSALDPTEYAPDEVQVVGHEAYLHTPNGMGKSQARPRGDEEARPGRHHAQLALRRPNSPSSRRAPTDTSRAGEPRHCTMKAVTIPNIIPSSFSAWLRMWQWYAHTPFSAAVGLTRTV